MVDHTSHLFLTGVGRGHEVVAGHQGNIFKPLLLLRPEFLVSGSLSVLHTDLPNPPNLLHQIADVLRIVLQTVND